MESITQSPEEIQERLRREETYAQALQGELDYNRRLFGVSNSCLSSAHKMVMWAVRRYVLTLWHDSNALGQFVEVHMHDLTVLTGLSADSVGKALKALHGLALIDRQDQKERLKNGTTHTHVFVALTILSYNPESLNVPDEKRRNHGGERQRCKFCGSDDLVKVTRVVCRCCNNQQEEDEVTPVNPPVAVDPVIGDDPPVSDVDTEKRSVVLLPVKPSYGCRFGCGHKWIWFSGNENEAAGYICSECLSADMGGA